jgi:arsenate reductase
MVKIFHNPECGTSRNTLALIRNSGVEPEVVFYLETPPPKEQLKQLIADMDIPVRDVLRQKGTPYEELDLGNAKWSWLTAFTTIRHFNLLNQYPEKPL